jgi:hypothetical protein
MTGNPDPVEVWAPIFLYYFGTQEAKFTKEQVLDPKWAIPFGHCKLCDDQVEGSHDTHMRAHRTELTGWLSRRRRQARAKSKNGLAAARREKKMLAEAESRV